MISLQLVNKPKKSVVPNYYFPVVFLLVGGMFLLPDVNRLWFVGGTVVFTFIPLLFDKKEELIGSLILSHHSINIKNFTDEFVVAGEDFANVQLIYSGYKGKVMQPHKYRMFSGTDNYISIITKSGKMEFKFFVENELLEEAILQMYSYWERMGYDVRDFRLNEF